MPSYEQTWICSVDKMQFTFINCGKRMSEKERARAHSQKSRQIGFSQGLWEDTTFWLRCMENRKVREVLFPFKFLLLFFEKAQSEPKSVPSDKWIGADSAIFPASPLLDKTNFALVYGQQKATITTVQVIKRALFPALEICNKITLFTSVNKSYDSRRVLDPSLRKEQNGNPVKKDATGSPHHSYFTHSTWVFFSFLFTFATVLGKLGKKRSAICAFCKKRPNWQRSSFS